MKGKTEQVKGKKEQINIDPSTIATPSYAPESAISIASEASTPAFTGAPDFFKIPVVNGLHVKEKVNPFILENNTTLADDSKIPEVELASVLISVAPDDSTDAQANRILAAFNQDIKKGDSAFTKDSVRGESIPKGSFWLAVRGQKAELHGESTTPIARSWTAAIGIKAKILQKDIKQSDRFYGACGKYVLNVPQGHYAKAISGTNSLLYGEGCHVIIDGNFRYEDKKADQADAVVTGLVSVNEPYISHGNKHILRVPTNKYAKITISSVPHILPGRKKPYVFEDATFQLEYKAKDVPFFDQSERYIQHGSIHILRVEQGKIAKIWVGQEALFLTSRKEPYVIMDPQFELVLHNKGRDFLFDQSEHYIQHGNKHILRVPQGQFAKVWIGNTAVVLQHQVEPYYIDSPLFKLEQNAKNEFLFNLTDPFISHGPQHFLRVPNGKIAKIWIGSKAFLKEEGSEMFTDTSFRLDKNGNELFFNATDSLIIHGNIKRVIPHTGSVCVTYNNGTLEILRPRTDGRPHVIESPTHEVVGFLDTGIETLNYPSDTTKAELLKENPKLTAEELSYLRSYTRDSLAVGVKLLVAFSITDPEKALTTLLSKEGILRHIESCAIADIGKAISKCSAQEFMNLKQAQPNKSDKADEPVQRMHYQEEVEAALTKELGEYGIKLIRLNVETPKIMDAKIAQLMADTSSQAAKANAEVSTLDQNYLISQRRAQQDADAKRIAQAQQNEVLITAAEAQKTAAELRKQATIADAEGDQQATILRAEADKIKMLRLAEGEAEAMKLKADAQKASMGVEGDALHKSPELLQLELAKVQAEALAKMGPAALYPNMAQGMVPSMTPTMVPGMNPAMAQMYLGANPWTLFSAAQTPVPRPASDPVASPSAPAPAKK